MAKSRPGFGPQYAGARNMRPVFREQVPAARVAAEAGRAAVTPRERTWLEERLAEGEGLEQVPAWARPAVARMARWRRPAQTAGMDGRGLELWLVVTHGGARVLATPGDVASLVAAARRGERL